MSSILLQKCVAIGLAVVILLNIIIVDSERNELIRRLLVAACFGHRGYNHQRIMDEPDWGL